MTTVLKEGHEQEGHYSYYIMTTPSPMSPLMYHLWMIIGSATAAVFSTVCTVMTIVLGPGAAKILWAIQASLTGAVCGSTLGLTFVPAFKHFVSWVPCMILGTATSLETIWTFNKKPKMSSDFMPQFLNG